MKKFIWSEDLVKKNENRFFKISKTLLTTHTWSQLPPASQKIYPVLGIHADKNGKAFPSKNRLQKLSGISSNNTFSVGIKGLRKSKLISYIRNPGTSSTYSLKKITVQQENERFFQIKSQYIYNGLWAMLPATAASVYITIGAFSQLFQFGKHPEWLLTYIYGSEDLDIEEKYEKLRVSDLSITQIQHYSGVSKTSVIKSIKILDDEFKMIKRLKRNNDYNCLDQSNYYLIPILFHFSGEGELVEGCYEIDKLKLNTTNINKLRNHFVSKYNY